MTERRVTSDDVVAAVKEALARLRGEHPPVDGDTQLHELALESLEIVEIFIVLEERTGAAISIDGLDGLVKVADIATLESL